MPQEQGPARMMKILLASSEMHPFSKTGGLADMTGALSKALAEAGHQVGIVTPLYRGIFQRFPQIQRVDWRFDLPLGGKWVNAELWQLPSARNLTVYFIHQPDYFDRPGLQRERSGLLGQRRAVHLFLQMRGASSLLFTVATGNGACPRLADGAGAVAAARGMETAGRGGESTAHLPDDS